MIFHPICSLNLTYVYNKVINITEDQPVFSQFEKHFLNFGLLTHIFLCISSVDLLSLGGFFGSNPPHKPYQGPNLDFP